MSGRLDSPNRRTARTVPFILAIMLLAAVGFSGVSPATGQPPADPSIDDRRPQPPAEPGRAQEAEKYRIPNPKARIFTGTRDPNTGATLPNTGIVDFEPVASEKDHADEYQAWNFVVGWARQFGTAELEEYAGRDLTRDDLAGPARFQSRLDLVRFEGKLKKVSRWPATRALQEAGTAEVYEALLVPLDEPPTDVVSVAFTE